MDFFQTTRWCLAVVGHSLQQQRTKKDWSQKSFWFSLSIVGSANIWMIWFTAYAIEDLPLATASLSVSMTNMLTVLKGATFLCKKKTFLLQMQQLRDLNEKFKKLEIKGRLFKAHATTAKYEHRYRQLCIMTGFYFCLMPLTQVLYQFLNGQSIEMQLPYPLKLPFEYQDLTTYIILFIYCTVVTWFIVFYVPGIDCLFYSFAINVSTHFQILQDIIRADDFKGTERELHETLAGYAKHHNFLLEMSERMRVLFKPVIIVQFLLTSLQVCLIVFQIVTNSHDFVVVVPNATFLFVILVQLLFYCYGGEILMHESVQVNWAIQTSHWYNLPPKLRMPLGFIMQRSQKPVIIQAAFYKATLETFMTIVQTAASYITLMQSLD